MNEEEKKADESTETQTEESAERKPSDYELKLRKENEKLRKDLQAKLDAEKEEKERILKEQGDYKKLYEESKPEIEKAKTLQAKLDAIELKTKEQLLSKLPEGKREEFKDWTSDQLEKVVGMVETEATPPTDKSKRITKPNIKPEDKTREEKIMGIYK